MKHPQQWIDENSQSGSLDLIRSNEDAAYFIEAIQEDARSSGLKDAINSIQTSEVKADNSKEPTYYVSPDTMKPLTKANKDLIDCFSPTPSESATQTGIQCDACGSKEHMSGDCPELTEAIKILKASYPSEPQSSCEQSETFGWKVAMKLFAEDVEIEMKFEHESEWTRLTNESNIVFWEIASYRRKPEPSPATPDKKEEWGLPAENQTVHNPSCAYLLGRIENLESVVRKFISKSEYEKVRHQ